MDPLDRSEAFNTITSASAVRAFSPDSSPAVFGASASRNGAKAVPTPRPSRNLPTNLLARAIQTATDVTSVSIAEATRQSIEDVRAQLKEVTDWLAPGVLTLPTPEPVRPPTIPRDYIAAFRKNLLNELDAVRGLDAGEVVRLMLKVDEASEGWKQTDRGKFISRLTGADCADAVVAIAHDIRSPLCSILLLVDALRKTEKAAVNPIRERQLGLIYGAAFGLSTTVSNLIGAARGEDLVQGKAMPFSISEMMHSVSAIVQPMCEEKGIPLDVELPKHDARIGHSSAIQQSLVNLTSNALRYTDAGWVAMGCTEVSEDRVEFWVEDTGPGIPDDVLERLCYGFPPEGVKLRFSSAGLGLAIVRTLVEAMGSTLQVDSGPSGTRFSFVLALPIVH